MTKIIMKYAMALVFSTVDDYQQIPVILLIVAYSVNPKLGSAAFKAFSKIGVGILFQVSRKK